jgi:hypothetical protein
MPRAAAPLSPLISVSALHPGTASIADGGVISALHRQHRAVEFGKFLVAIDKAVPAELDLHYSRTASSRKRSAKPAGSDRNGEWSLSK